MDSRIGNLDSPVKTFRAPGRQGIHNNQCIRFCLLHNTLYDFCGFHSRHSHNPGDDTAYHVHFFAAVGRFPVFLYHMPVDEQIIHHFRSQGICRDIPVAKSHDKNGLFLLNIRD